jgi:hypothetical protein
LYQYPKATTATIQTELATSKRAALGEGSNDAEGTVRKNAVIVAARNQVTIAADGRTLASRAPITSRKMTMSHRVMMSQPVDQSISGDPL